MQNSSAFQYLAIDIIHESTTNPRRTFEESKRQELADAPFDREDPSLNPLPEPVSPARSAAVQR